MHNRLHAIASKPDGPAEPSVCNAACLMSSGEISSKMSRCRLSGVSAGGSPNNASGFTDFALGCFSLRMFRTGVPSILSSRLCIPLVLVLDSSFIAALVLPVFINLVKVWVILASGSDMKSCLSLSCLWIISFSLISSVNSPSSHRSKRRLKQVMWSLTLDLMLGFCRRSEGMHMAALIEIDSSADCWLKA